MNKIYLLIFTILLFTHNLKGQEKNKNERSNVIIGINIGPNSNTLRGDSFAEKYDSNINFFSGLSLEYKIKENFSILTNVNYEVKSVKSEYNATVGFLGDFQTVDIKDKTKFQYLNIPLLARYYIGFENEFFINGGLFYNHLLDVTNETINQDNGENLNDLDYNELFKNKDFGISFGIGMTFKINSKSNLAIEIRDDYGLSNIGNTEFGGVLKSKTNSIKLVANWNFNL